MKNPCDCKWYTRCKKLSNCKKPVASWPIAERKLSANDSPELDTAMAVMLMQTSSVECERPTVVKTWEPQHWTEPADSYSSGSSYDSSSYSSDSGSSYSSTD